MTALEFGRDYIQRGWRIVLIPAGAKGPRVAGWQALAIGLADVFQDFTDSCNIGVILGPGSGELVDIDLDCTEALALADRYLPPTRAEFGRYSKPRAHRLYITPGAVYGAFADPLDGSMLVELRAAGRDGGAHQTMFPPSLHPSGERIEWHGVIIAPAVISAAALRIAVAWL